MIESKGMGFWKNLFSSKTKKRSQPIPFPGELLDRNCHQAEGKQILFSTESEIDVYELEELCDRVGWARRPIRKVKKALKHSFLVVCMWEVRGSHRRLIGFARATSDYAFNATIWDVVVDPQYQKKGLGKAMMKFMIRKLRKEDISNITLFADPHVINFYENLGFILDPEGIKGMFWYPD
jgi:GNAT superfamily N-acetyltransferase